MKYELTSLNAVFGGRLIFTLIRSSPYLT